MRWTTLRVLGTSEERVDVVAGSSDLVADFHKLLGAKLKVLAQRMWQIALEARIKARYSGMWIVTSIGIDYFLYSDYSTDQSSVDLWNHTVYLFVIESHRSC